jgi:DNA-binding transcriptional LysR family regulator
MRLQFHTENTLETVESIERRDEDVGFIVRETSIPPTIVIEPFFSEDMVLLRLAAPGRINMELVDIESLQPEHEIIMNYGTDYQVWHDKWWNPMTPSHMWVHTAGLIPIIMYDVRQWAIVAKSIANAMTRSAAFVVQYLSESPPKRTYYKLTHKYPRQSTLQALHILDHYLQDVVLGEMAGIK